MPRYFTTISHLNNPKNKLQDEVQQFFKRHANRVFSDIGEKQGFEKYIRRSVIIMNERHRRCRPVDIDTMRMGGSSSTEKEKIFYIPGGHFKITEENLSYGN